MPKVPTRRARWTRLTDQTQAAQVFWEHQRFSGILVPTLCRISKVGIGGPLVAESPLVDIEIFDAVFE